MILEYFSDVDALFIQLREQRIARSADTDGVRLGYDEAGELVGINIERASERVTFGSIQLKHLPLDVPRPHRGS
jgi:YD repeat-containing protein